MHAIPKLAVSLNALQYQHTADACFAFLLFENDNFRGTVFTFFPFLVCPVSVPQYLIQLRHLVIQV